ncbi:hypothetical protein SCOCK_290096 [Actinacidiphila cocklensis]|uniref:Uncharacterized protein n=1 Tax=Actinacidiphila cocklensis TaxID=887465 RepID=A0A9W4GSH7_9ACTN|nr:hypothetical protein SCOCK_290096 [Actinacidiphila cocklensis]
MDLRARAAGGRDPARHPHLHRPRAGAGRLVPGPGRRGRCHVRCRHHGRRLPGQACCGTRRPNRDDRDRQYDALRRLPRRKPLAGRSGAHRHISPHRHVERLPPLLSAGMGHRRRPCRAGNDRVVLRSLSLPRQFRRDRSHYRADPKRLRAGVRGNVRRHSAAGRPRGRQPRPVVPPPRRLTPEPVPEPWPLARATR